MARLSGPDLLASSPIVYKTGTHEGSDVEAFLDSEADNPAFVRKQLDELVRTANFPGANAAFVFADGTVLERYAPHYSVTMSFAAVQVLRPERY